MTNDRKPMERVLAAADRPIDANGEEHAPSIDRDSMSPRLFGLAGSLRKGSYSLATLRGLQHELGVGVLTIGDLRLPLYDADQDGAASPAVIQRFRNDIAASDGLIIVTPEYNHGVPGVLKNALDCVNRLIQVVRLRTARSEA